MPNDTPSSSNRRRFLKTGIAAAGVAGLGPLAISEAAAAVSEPSALAGKPNILIIMIDEARYPPPYESKALAQFRKTYLSTEEALRQNGMEFQRHYAASVACAPSRGCFFTGHYPSRHGLANTDGSAKAPKRQMIRMTEGILLRGRVSYQVDTGSTPSASGRTALQAVHDLNDDGIADYVITYPSGDTQSLYLYPQQ